MKLEHIQMFLDIVHNGSINQASKQGYISQQGLSMAVKQLEAELNTSLFKRSNKGVKLTEEGEAFYYYSERMMMLYNDMLEEMDRGGEDVVYDLYLTNSIYELFGYFNEAPFAKKRGIYFSYINKNNDDDVISAINNRQGIAILGEYNKYNNDFKAKLRQDIRLVEIGEVKKLLYVCHKNMLPALMETENGDHVLEGKMCAISSNVYGLNITPHKVRNTICVPDIHRRKKLMRKRDVFSIMSYGMYRMYFDPTEFEIIGECEKRVGKYYAAFHLRQTEQNMRLEDDIIKVLREIMKEDDAPIITAKYNVLL